MQLQLIENAADQRVERFQTVAVGAAGQRTPVGARERLQEVRVLGDERPEAGKGQRSFGQTADERVGRAGLRDVLVRRPELAGKVDCLIVATEGVMLTQGAPDWR